MTIAQLIVLSLVCACADSARVVLGIESNFVCPSECVECCDSSSFFGMSGRSFKCILHDKTKIPASRECQETSQRNGNIMEWKYKDITQYKTHCKYNDGESDAPKKCSSTHICCCASKGNWHEEQCLDGPTQGLTTVQARANHTGQMETFQMRSEQVFANGEACRRPGNQHHPYDSKVVPIARGRPQSKSLRSTGCCLETATHTVEHYWTTQSGNWQSKDEDYTICVRHEELHYCSDDGGLMSNGKFVYDSVSQTQEGKCYGDEQPTDGKMLNGNDAYSYKCPNGVFKGEWCRCQGECGIRRRA